MAVFMINICKFNGCGITFPRLADLIEHIEDVHIDYDPAVVEQKEASQPACIPLSYVLKYFTEASRREYQNALPVPDVRRHLSAPKTPSVRSSTPTGSEMDEDELMSPSEDSNDSWTTVEEYSSEYILRYGVKMNQSSSSGALGAAAQEKPFACPVPGCKKRYKNVNGIKYHSKNGHKKDGKDKMDQKSGIQDGRVKAHGAPLPTTEDFSKKQFLNKDRRDSKTQFNDVKSRKNKVAPKICGVKKAYRCQCGKSYKTAQGLKSHSIAQHIATSQPSTSAPAPAPLEASRPHLTKMPGLVVTASPHSRPINIIEGIDGNKLVRIYDSIKTKDLPTFTIPKHNLTNLNIVSASQHGQVVRHGMLTPSSTPGSSPIDKMKFDRSPRVTVQNTQPLTPLTPSHNNDAMTN